MLNGLSNTVSFKGDVTVNSDYFKKDRPLTEKETKRVKKALEKPKNAKLIAKIKQHNDTLEIKFNHKDVCVQNTKTPDYYWEAAREKGLRLDKYVNKFLQFVNDNIDDLNKFTEKGDSAWIHGYPKGGHGNFTLSRKSKTDHHII